MRTYAPADTEAVLARVLEEPIGQDDPALTVRHPLHRALVERAFELADLLAAEPALAIQLSDRLDRHQPENVHTEAVEPGKVALQPSMLAALVPQTRQSYVVEGASPATSRVRGSQGQT